MLQTWFNTLGDNDKLDRSGACNRVCCDGDALRTHWRITWKLKDHILAAHLERIIHSPQVTIEIPHLCEYTNKFIRTALEMQAKYIKIRYHAVICYIYISYTYIHIRNGPHDIDARAFRHSLKYLHWAVLNWETLDSAVPGPGLPCGYTQ